MGAGRIVARAGGCDDVDAARCAGSRVACCAGTTSAFHGGATGMNTLDLGAHRQRQHRRPGRSGGARSSGAACRASTATPVFCSLLRERRRPRRTSASSPSTWWTSRAPSRNTWPTPPSCVTRLYDQRGGAVEITDFAPRFRQFGRMFHPDDAGAPRARASRAARASRVRLRPGLRLRQPASRA
ncbi:MAG: hypothetical protein MZW92_80410 [Comamonadaceae bacterium]|nr:hypothetical protein [Comamonadaceae bacterium]